MKRSLVPLLCLLALCFGPVQAASADETAACDHELAPGGAVQAFADSLATGEVGCLRGGTYSFSSLHINRPGITLTSYPGDRATLSGGYIYVPPESPDVTLDGLRIDTARFGGIGVQLFSSGVRLLNSEVTNEHLGESCVTLSNYDGGFPTMQSPVVRGNHIHGCGRVLDGAHDHGIYVANARGAVVSDNLFEDVHGGWGIQLWTTSINGVFERNVIRASPTATEGGVVIVAGDSTGNEFRHNTLVSNGRPFVVDDYGAPDGAKFSSNCIVAAGAPLFESLWFDGGDNRTVGTEADCGSPVRLDPLPDPQPAPDPQPPSDPEPGADPATLKLTAPTGDIAVFWVCPTAEASAGTEWVRFTLDGSNTSTAHEAPWTSTCWHVAQGEHTLTLEASTGATDQITFVRR
jgi:nitrous oxidase accessory protein NosD